MDTRLKKYYLKKIYGGRSALARFLDFVLFRTLLMVGLFFVLFQLSRSLTTALLVSIFLTLAASISLTLWRSKRIERYIKKDLQKIKEKCLLETLTFMTPSEFADYMNRLIGGLKNISVTDYGFSAQKNSTTVCVFHNHPSVLCDVADILGVLRSGNSRRIVFVTLSDFTDDAKTLCRGREQHIELIGGECVLSMADKAGMMPDEQTAQRKAEKEMNQSIVTLKNLKESALNRSKVKGYMVCGIIALFWPFVMGFKIYYPIIGAVCFLLAAVAYRKGQNTRETSGFGIS